MELEYLTISAMEQNKWFINLNVGSFGRLELGGKSSTNSTISVQDGVNNGILLTTRFY